MTDRQSTLGLILAGGQGRRMGGADKALVVLGGRPIVSHVVERLTPQCAALALSANGDPARFSAFGLPVLADGLPGFLGPLAGILAGMEWARAWRPAANYVASLPVDAPFAPTDFVARLHAARRGADADIVMAASGGRSHRVAALWRAELGCALRRALEIEGVRKVEAFAARHRVAVVEWPAEPIDPFFNINTPQDLADAEAALSHASGGSRLL
jgi:molybdopterin-guanine dinucleotide biosynthesis protein A